MITQDGDTDSFQITTGILQGDIQDPYIFVLVLNYFMGKSLDGRKEDCSFKMERIKGRRADS